jgi:hypothetical protein
VPVLTALQNGVASSFSRPKARLLAERSASTAEMIYVASLSASLGAVWEQGQELPIGFTKKVICRRSK